MSHHLFEEPTRALARPRPAVAASRSTPPPTRPPEGDRWSTWDGAQHGPSPRPDWVVTELGAVDTDLGVLKTGKEADVHVVRRWVPGTGAEVLMAAKRYRTGDHRLFHRDAGYLEGRRVRRSREMRAMARRTDFGKEVIAGQWAGAEFDALGELWGIGLPVPYPVQLDGTEVLMEFIGTGRRPGRAAAGRRPAGAGPARRAVRAVPRARCSSWRCRGWAHGDLSPYNVLLHEERLVLIDWPQIVDVIGNPRGPEFLERDCHNMCAWFAARGLEVDEGLLFGDLMGAATSRW